MDEAKTLTNMAISAILASLFLSAAAGLIALGYNMWSYFSRQDAANNKMSDYVNYTAFDNTTVRGQDVISLLESDLDIFVIVTLGWGKDTDIENLESVYTVEAVYTSDVADVANFDFSRIDSSSYSNVTSMKSIKAVQNYGGTPQGFLDNYENIIDLNKAVESNNLVKIFTTTWMGFPEFGLGRADYDADEGAATANDPNEYDIFKSTLIYNPDVPSEIIGIILTQPSYATRCG